MIANDSTRPPNALGGVTLNAWLMIGLFGAFLLAPTVAQLMGIGIATTENRVLAPFPSINRFKDIKDLTQQADAYVNDRFGLRSHLVHLNSLVRYRLGLSSNKLVAIGRNNWLFYANDRILEQHTGADVFTAEELEHWVRQMEANRDWLEKRGIAFYIVAAPEKSTIYPEMLPDYPRPPGASTRLDQLAARLPSSTLEFVDPRAALIAAKKAGVQVYLPGDTHWTQRGALIAYGMLMDRLRARFPHIVPKTIDDYMVSDDPHPPADLARLLTLQDDLRYTGERLEPRGPRHQLGPAEITYRAGWPWRIAETHTDLKDRPRLLVMGDSFTDYVLGPDFLYETFRDPVWTNHHLGNFNFDLVKEVNPDIVIFQFAERYLTGRPGVPVGMEPEN
jgi:alginate O-acetyltransferase complex protein AlgJ